MDLSKAFDTLNHDLLVGKLNAYGFSEESLKLIKSYLTNCWQRAKVNISWSSWSKLLLGIPQENIYIYVCIYIFMTGLRAIMKLK